MEKITKREIAYKKIGEAFDFARKAGFKIVIASDEEANTFNELHPKHIFYDGDVKDNVIAIGVLGLYDEAVFEGEDEDSESVEGEIKN